MNGISRDLGVVISDDYFFVCSNIYHGKQKNSHNVDRDRFTLSVQSFKA